MLALAEKLAQCEGAHNPCGSLACPVCNRRWRLVETNGFVRFCQENNCRGVAHVTLLADAWSVSESDYKAIKLSNINAVIRYQLKQAGFDRFILAYIEAENDDDRKTLDFHVHMLIPYKNKSGTKTKLKILRDRFYTTVRHAKFSKPMVVQFVEMHEVRDMLKVTTYAQKSYWGRTNEAARKRNVKYRIKNPLHSRLLVWLDAHHRSNVRIIIGASFRQGVFTLSS